MASVTWAHLMIKSSSPLFISHSVIVKNPHNSLPLHLPPFHFKLKECMKEKPQNPRSPYLPLQISHSPSTSLTTPFPFSPWGCPRPMPSCWPVPTCKLVPLAEARSTVPPPGWGRCGDSSKAPTWWGRAPRARRRRGVYMRWSWA